MTGKRTNKAYTEEILGGYLMNDNKLNVDYLADVVWITVVNDRVYRNQITTARTKNRNIAIMQLRNFVDFELSFAGYRGYYCTNEQLIHFDREHGGSLEAVLDILENWIDELRKEEA